MKKFLGKKDKGDKEDKESKKEKKEKEKKEKKEKKKEAKEAKLAAKGNSGNSSTNLEKTQESVTVVKTTTLSSSPGTETRKVVTETTQHDNGEQSTVTTTVQETKSKSNEPSVVQKTTTTIVKSSSEDPENEIKTVTQTSESVEENESAAPLEDNEEKTVTVVKKEVTISPDSEEKVVITKTTSQVESIPSTRELLENSFPQAAMLDKTSILRESTNDDDGLTSQHFSKTTIIRSENGDSIETTTQVVTDESGTKTTTTTSGGSDDGPIVSVHSDSKADLPDWLETRDEKRPVNGKAAIDDSIEIPSPEVGRKEMKKTEHSGPPVKEQITPEAEKKEDIANFLDSLSDSGKEKSKDEEKQPIKDDTNVVELMDALESAPPSKDDTLTDSNKEKTTDEEQQAAKDDGMDELLDALQSSNKPQNDTRKGKPKDEKQPSKADNNLSDLMDALESDSTEPKPAKVNQPSPMKQTPSRTNEKPSTVQASPRRLSPQVSSPRRLAKPKTKEKVLLERHAKKLMKNGEVYETITEIFKDKDGKIETTTTTKKLEYQPQEVIDLNVNLLQSKPIQGTEKKKQYEDDDPFVHEGDEINPEEVFEEILVVQKKPKVRFPKSFLPRTPERPKSWGLPLDLLVERQRSPRRSVGYMYGREVNENVKPVSKNKMTELQELDRMLEVIGASD